MGITFNIHKSRCIEYKKGKLIGYEIPYIIGLLEKEGSLIARIYAKALEADNYNGEAKYYRYELSNKSRADIAYFKKDEAICKLIELCRQYNDENHDNKIKYGYFKDNMGPDTMKSVFVVMPNLNNSGKTLCFHTDMSMDGLPIFTEKKAPHTGATNRTVIAGGIISMFGELFPRNDYAAYIPPKEKTHKVDRKPKLGSDLPILNSQPVAKKVVKEEKKEEKNVGPNVRNIITTNITSGMTQVEKFAERFRVFRKK